ncbi:hypothetical protein HKX48_006002, partial [Thoreauomyces humboldtii]
RLVHVHDTISAIEEGYQFRVKHMQDLDERDEVERLVAGHEDVFSDFYRIPEDVTTTTTTSELRDALPQGPPVMPYTLDELQADKRKGKGKAPALVDDEA